jgi:hypothetical protein
MLSMVNEITVDAFCHEVKFIHLVKGITTACVAASLLYSGPQATHGPLYYWDIYPAHLM